MHVNCERLSVISIEPSNNNKIKKINPGLAYKDYKFGL